VSQITRRSPSHTVFSPHEGKRQGVDMRKILPGLVLAALIAQPAPAQDYRKNFVECARELGLNPDATATHKLQSGGTLRAWQLHSEAQQAAFNDCVTRKASLANKPSTSSKPSASAARRDSR
jgi:hypothetical protein